MPEDLTPKQRHLLEYLKAGVARYGNSPSLRQAAADLGVSHAAVAQLVRTLEDKGYVRREGRYSRTLRVLSRTEAASGDKRWREVPVIGRIAAGLPLYAQQEWDGAVVLDADIYRGRNLFALRIRGDSMKDAGILPGDLVICEPRQYAVNGEIVAALINEHEATVKRFFLGEGFIELRPENEKYAAGRYAFDEVLIQGKVIGVQRDLQSPDRKTDFSS
jgi:repressor LexA